MKKAVKIILWTLGALLGLGVVLLLSLPLWIGPAVKTVAQAVVPSYTGCDFRLASFSLNPFTGRLQLVEAHLSNPRGFSQPEAFSVATVRVDVAVGSLLTSTIHVREIAIEGPFVGYFSANGTNNFAAILAHVEAKTGPSEKKPKEAVAKEGAGKKVVIDRFRLAGTRVNLGMLPLAIPTIELTDIGKDTGGATFKEVCDAVWANLEKFVTGVGNMASELLKGTGNAASNLVKGAGDAASGLVKGAEGTAKDLVKGAGDTATGLVKGVADGVGTASGKTGEAIGKGVKSAAEGLRKINPFGK